MSKVLLFSYISLLLPVPISLGTLQFKFGVVKSFYEDLRVVKSFGGVYNDRGLKNALRATVANIPISFYFDMYIEMIVICI